MTTNNNMQKSHFAKVLGTIDKQGIDMSVCDWAKSLGLMEDYGHGEIWDLPKDEDGWIDDEAIAKQIEEYIEEEIRSLAEIE